MTVAITAQRVGDPLWQIQVQQRFNRDWAPHLSVEQRSMVQYVMDQTVYWQTTHIDATMNQLLAGGWTVINGIRRQIQKFWHSRATLFRWMDELVRMGLIARRHMGRYIRITLNIDWQPGGTQMVAAPKRLQNAPGCKQASMWDRDDGHRMDSLGAETETRLAAETPYKESYQTKEDVRFREEQPAVRKRTRPTPKPAEVASKTIRAVAAEPPAPKPVIIGSDTQPLGLIWTLAWKHHYPEVTVPKLASETRAILGNVKVAYDATGRSFNAFFGWTLCNWRQVMRTKHFNWMDNPPRYPDLRVLLSTKLRRRFEEAYADHLHAAKQRNAREWQDRFEWLVQNGLTHEEALRQVAEEKMSGDKRQKEDSREARFQMEWEALQAERKALRQRGVGQVTPPAPGKPRMPVTVRPDFSKPEVDLDSLTVVDFGRFEDVEPDHA